MSIIYRTYNKDYQYINGERWKSRMYHTEVDNYETLVDEGVLIKEEADDEWRIAGETIDATETMCIGILDSGKVYVAEEPSASWDGIIASTATANKAVAIIRAGRAVVRIGEKDISNGSQIVAGPGGKAVVYNASNHSLISSFQGAATDDFDNSVWGTDGDYPIINLTADVETDRGKSVVLHVIDEDDEYTTVTLELDEEDTRTEVTGTTKIKKLLAVYVEEDISGTLVVKSSSGTCKSLTAPDGWYGVIAYEDSSDAKGHAITLQSANNVTGTIVVMGTDGADEVQTEVLSFSSQRTATTTKGYKTLERILIGDDGNATETWSAYIPANSEDQIVGTLLEAGAAQNTALMTVAIAADTAVGPGSPHTHELTPEYATILHSLGIPAAPDDDAILSEVNLTNTTFTPDHQPDVARCIVVTITDTTPSITEGTVTISGTDINGDNLTVAIDCSSGAGDYVTAKAFASITSIVASDFATLGGSGDETIKVGTTNVFGLPYTPRNNVGIVFVDGVSKACTIDYTNATVTPSTEADGSSAYIVMYSVEASAANESSHRHALET